MNRQPIVQLSNLSWTFREGETRRQVLDHITFDFEPGEFVALLGQSGSGKSTLLNLISGIEKPTTGDVTINGFAITQKTERDRTLFRRDQIGIVFQFFNLIPTLTVLENITLPQELAGVSQRKAAVVARDLLEKVGMADRERTFPDKLSGGEQQRVAISRALAHNPMLVLADEPTGNLDSDTGDKVLDVLLDLTRQAGKTLIMATHSPSMTQHADRVVNLQGGRLIPAVNRENQTDQPFLASGANSGALIDQLQAAFAGREDIVIQSTHSVREASMFIFDRSFTITIALQLVATVVAFIGVLSALMSLELDRAHELGVFRAIGMTTRQLWKLMFIETGLMGGMAGLMALPTGCILAWILVRIINVRSFGWTLQMHFESAHFLRALLVAVVAALAAGMYPAWRLGRMTIRTAIRAE